MLIAGIINHDDSCETANLVSLIMSETGVKVSIVDSKLLSELDCKRISSYINELDKNNTDILLLKINLKDIDKEFLKFINFDIIIHSEKSDDLIKEEHKFANIWKTRLLSSLKDNGTVIVNIDDSELVEYLQRMKCNIITYGFNSKACITASSIGDTISNSSFICCQQKIICAKNGKKVEPQEYKIEIENTDADEYDLLAAASFAIANGIDLNSALKAKSLSK